MTDLTKAERAVLAAADAWLDDPCKGLGGISEHDLVTAVRNLRRARAEARAAGFDGASAPAPPTVTVTLTKADREALDQAFHCLTVHCRSFDVGHNAAKIVLDRLSHGPSIPRTARNKIDVFLDAFDALAVHRADVSTATDVDRVDRTVVLGVHTPAEVAALAAELDLPQPVNRINGDGYRWVESADYRERGTTIVIQGGHRSRRDTAA